MGGRSGPAAHAQVQRGNPDAHGCGAPQALGGAEEVQGSQVKRAFLPLLFAVAAAAQIDQMSGERIRAHVKYLAGDLLEGRGVGTRGGDLAAEYIATQFALLGAKPAGDNGTYFQKLTLVGAEPLATTELSTTLNTTGSGKTISFRWLDEFVGVTYQQKPDVEFDADAVFVGHGITAPEFQW